MAAKRILIVDDEPSIVLSLEYLMKEAGYEVKTANDGNTALQLIQSHLPDLVLLDVNLPQRNGYEICRAIRNEPAHRRIRIIMLTAKGSDIEREKGMSLGADNYITKPFSTQEVLDKVKALLDA